MGASFSALIGLMLATCADTCLQFNLTLPEVDVHRNDLKVFQSVSNYPESSGGYGIPPLLIAFILDTSDLPNGQAVIWEKDGSRYTIDPAALVSNGHKGKGKEKDERSGIVLERWTLNARCIGFLDVHTVELISSRKSTEAEPSSSALAMAPHTAYRYGIIHFRALFSLVRLLPSYRLFRRLRRANNGLRLGIKLWAPEGYGDSSEDMLAAWETMESGLVSMDVGLDRLVTTNGTSPDQPEFYDLPQMDMFGSTYSLKVEYRPNVDFHVEDMESVLSEKFVDMDEDWFTPTVGGRPTGTDVPPRSPPAYIQSLRKGTTPTAIPSTSPIPQRQQAATPGSFGSAGRPSFSRGPSAMGGAQSKGSVGSYGSRWGALAEGLPFAGPSPSPGPAVDASRVSGLQISTIDSAPFQNDTRLTSVQETDSQGSSIPGSSGAAAAAARRLSGHSVHPFNTSTSPSTSLLRGTPPGGPQMRPGSVGRTSSFLSQSGRSFTHAQLANMPGVGTSPPIQSPVSPSSLSFTKQPMPRPLSNRPPYMSSSPSPFIPGSLEREAPPMGTGAPGSFGASPQFIKRYSTQRQTRAGPSGSHSSAEGTSLPGSTGLASQQPLRRSSTRTSQESALRYSAAIPGPDDDDIQAFLKTLDALPQPPSVAAQTVQASRSHLPSTSSSLSAASIPPSPSPLHTSGGSPSGAAPHPPARAPLTRTQIGENLKRMAGSFNMNTSKLVESTTVAPIPAPPVSSTPATSSASNSNPSSISVGLITASRPANTARRISVPEGRAFRSSPMPTSPSQLPLPSSPTRLSTLGPIRGQTAAKPPSALPRSLPGPNSGSLSEDPPLPPLTAKAISGTTHLSPQTTGTSTATNESRTSRRGPVLLRGGFEGRTTKASTSSSPSHSPIRDFARMGLGPSNRLATRAESVSLGYGHGYRKSAGQRTAPSSFGAQESGLDKEEERGRKAGVRGALSDKGIDENELGNDGKGSEGRRGFGGLGKDW